MAERASHQQLYQAFKDLYKFMPYVSAFVVRGVTQAWSKMPWVRERFVAAAAREHPDNPVAAAARAADNMATAENVLNDGLNVAAFSAIDAFSLGRAREILLDTFRVAVASEKGVADPQKIRFDDLKHSSNMLVQLALERYQKNHFYAWAINIPFAVVTAMPFLAGPINQVGRMLWPEQFGRLRHWATAGDDASQTDMTPKELSGHATRPIMGIKAFYFLGTVLSQGKNSTTGMEALGDTFKRVNEEVHSRHLVNDVYNKFVEELQQKHPTYFPSQEAQRNVLVRGWHQVQRLFDRRPEPLWRQWGIEPMPVSESDKFSRGVFKLMSEQLRTAMDTHRYNDYGMRNSFDLGAFAYLVGHGWVDIRHPENTQLWVRIASIDGVDGLKRMEDILRQEVEAHGKKWVPTPQRMNQMLQEYHVEAQVRQLEQQVKLAPELVLNVVREDGMTERKVIDTFVAADVLGAYLVDYMLGGADRVRQPETERQMRSEITISQKGYEDFVKEFEARLLSETRPDYRLRNPHSDQIARTIEQLIVQGTLAVGEDSPLMLNPKEPKYTTKNVLEGALILQGVEEGSELKTSAEVERTKQLSIIEEEAERFGHRIPERSVREGLRAQQEPGRQAVA